jgi:superfamily I DNA/RNA helicase
MIWMVEIEWSPYQLVIFEAVKSLTNHLKIEALAGSGKTTTLVQCLSYLPSNWLALAFNVKNENDLKAKAPRKGKVYNFNKLGFILCHQNLKEPKVDQNKTLNLLEKLTKGSLSKDCLYEVSQVVSLAKSSLSSSEWEVLDLLHEYNFSSQELPDDDFATLVIQCLEASKKETSIIDLSDQIWLPITLNFDFPTFSTILVDEAQDLDLAQIEFVSRLAEQKEGTRVIYFGDRHQAMYQFRGAKNAIDLLDEQFNPNIFPLPISYRSARKIISRAQSIVPEIEARPNAPEGLEKFITSEQMLDLAKPGCFILSRTNAPLVPLVFYFLKKKIPCNIQGRKFGTGFLSLVYKSKAKSIADFKKFLLSWAQEEKKKLEEIKKPTVFLMDKVECLSILSSSVGSIKELIELIQKMFSDQEDESKIVLSTVHRAKGLERETVFVLMDTFLGFSEEENNIRYVAYTRAKNELYLVSDPKKKKYENSKKSFSSSNKDANKILEDNVVDLAKELQTKFYEVPYLS